MATLAQLSLQQSKIEQAVKMFERQVELARSEPELVNALTYQYVRGLFSLHLDSSEKILTMWLSLIRRLQRRWCSSRITQRWRHNLVHLPAESEHNANSLQSLASASQNSINMDMCLIYHLVLSCRAILH